MYSVKKKIEARIVPGPCLFIGLVLPQPVRQLRKDGHIPLEKVTGLEMMPERNFMARYHGTAATTAYGKAVKWFAVFHYTTQEGERMLALWYTEPKTGSVLRELAVQIGAATQDYTL